ncbi:MAG: WcbI family polysaccharide biosynthesis putative acetyltransferase [Candidatus Baltobacteraceae bacterium]
MRIGIVGTCQVVGMRVALQALVPGALIDAYHVGVHPAITAGEIAARLSTYDFVISQMLSVHGYPELEFERVREQTRAASLIPPLVFTGFHPDSCYIFNNGQAVASDVGFYHSAIAAAGFLLGLASKRTLRLYNAYIYEELGYFADFEISRRHLVAFFSNYGFDLSLHIDNWLSDGCFMHTINHPKVNVLATLATLGAQSAGIIEAEVCTPRNLVDPLEENVAWAVYPEISKRLGMAPGPGFRRAARGNEAGRSVELGSFVHSSYERYEDVPREALYYDRIAVAYEKLKALL